MEATFDDYEELYPERLTEDEFDSLLPSATAYLSVITHNRWKSAEDWKRERAIQALFAIVNAMAADQSKSNAKGARLSSVTNDGYTESYASDAASGSTIRHAAYEWLSGTGLVGAL